MSQHHARAKKLAKPTESSKTHACRVVAVDHLVVRVSDYDRSKDFYARLFDFLGFEMIGDFSDMTGWRNGLTAFWISKAGPDASPYRECDVGFQHYAFEMRDRADVDALQAFLREIGAEIADPAGAYYQDYYAVYFRDPDGMKLEGMIYGPGHNQAARQK